MVLFKSIKSLFRRLKKQSFTFHYGPIQITSDVASYRLPLTIYIPLWSYSNEKNMLETIKTDLFTFHYGPIQIDNGLTALKVLMRFTFHYGPIQM